MWDPVELLLLLLPKYSAVPALTLLSANMWLIKQ